MNRLSFTHLSKAYNGVPALRDVSITLTGGRVHALMGENGAGKSTLIKLIAGVTRADSLTYHENDRPVPLAGPQDVQAAGFRFIHQELNIVPQISVAENILLGRDYPRRFGLAIDWPRMQAIARAALAELEADHIDPRVLAGDLSTGDKMLVKIAAALVADAGRAPVLFVLDEPTAALTGAESDKLFAVIARLKARGAAILYVSHRIDEVMDICDDVTVLRDGRHISTGPVTQMSKDQIIHAMTGREMRDAYPARESRVGTNVVAEVTGAETARLSGLNFTLRKGEILGVGGLAEAGQSALLEMFMGLEPLRAGRGVFDDNALPRAPAEAWARGIAYLPRERRAEALMLNRSIRSNIVLPHLGGFGVLAKSGQERRAAQAMCAEMRVKCDHVDQPVGELSGGNQQKVVFARALHGKPRLLLLDEPTRGVDVGAKFDIYASLRAQSAEGCAVILTSSDLPEMLGLCDRVLILQDGRQTEIIDCAGLHSADLLTRYYPAAKEP